MNFRFSHSPQSSHKKSYTPGSAAITLTIRLAIGIGLLAFLFARKADLQSVIEILRNARPSLVLLALAIAVTGEVLTAWKWSLLVKRLGGRLPLLRAVRTSFIGMFYNNFFPGSVGGDIARILIIARDAGGKARATASAFMQRNTGLAGLFIIGIPAAFLWPRQLDWPELAALEPGIHWLSDCRTWLLAALAGYALANILLFSRYAYRRLWRLSRQVEGHLPAGSAAPATQPPTPSALLLRRAVSGVAGKIQRFHAELHGYRFWMTAPLALSVVTQIIDIFLVWTLSQALGLAIPLPVLMVTVPMVTLANLMPITVNGIGLRETMYVALLHSAGASASQAMALSLMQFGVMITLAAVGGALHGLETMRSPASAPPAS